MLFALWMLASSPALAGRVTPARAAECAVIVAAGAVRHGAPLRDALAMLRWWIGESGCRADAVNPESGACSWGQFLGAGRRGHACAELRDPELAAEVWLDDLDEARDRCGSTFGALSVVSGGRCDVLPAFVRGRCVSAGLDPDCEEHDASVD